MHGPKGELVGSDENGNSYYERKDLMHTVRMGADLTPCTLH